MASVIKQNRSEVAGANPFSIFLLDCIHYSTCKATFCRNPIENAHLVQEIHVYDEPLKGCKDTCGGGPLVFEVGYHPRKKIHIIRVVLQDQATNAARISLRGVKIVQNWKKRVCFGHIDKFWKGHDGQVKKNASKNEYLGSIFTHVWKISVKGVFWKSFYEDDIQPEIQVPSPLHKQRQ